ncbi:MAG TPA: pilin [Candidatus Saccharimonadales bacterium]|nr:pilin [Candidatus Saccharimonadales bacterium]
MLKYLRNSLATLTTAIALIAAPLAVPAIASADTTGGTSGTANVQGNLSCGINLSANTGDCSSDTTTGAGKVQGIVTQMINIFSLVVGIISVIMIIYGGFKYITSGGDSGNVTGARNTITYAVIGLVIVALAQFIVQFVLSKVTNAGSSA